MTDPFEQPHATRLAVFGHPTHELAILGLIQRHRPHILVITDGGGEERMAQSLRGLELLGLQDQATYLGYPEKSFYDALLDGDLDLFQRVVSDIRSHIERLQPDQIFCDAIEFYNPVHDITRPLLLSAMAGMAPRPLFEIPLVYQKPGPGESYEIQRVPDALAGGRLHYHLSTGELEAKIYARDYVHTCLRSQAGPEFFAATPEHLSREEIADARGDLPAPDSSVRVLRYEWRADLLRSQGAIGRAITYRDHFVPMCERLLPSG